MSVKKKYQYLLEEQPAVKDEPVASPPRPDVAPVAEAPKPPEPVETQPPEEKAAQEAVAIQLRLREVERAERLAAERKAQSQQPPPVAPPPEQQQQAVPPAVQEFLREHPEYADPNNHVARAEIAIATRKVTQDGLTWSDDNFIPTIERYLGLRQHPQANGHDAPKQNAPPPRPPDHSRGQASASPPRRSVPMSAPPTREVPSMATGRPYNAQRALNNDERLIASTMVDGVYIKTQEQAEKVYLQKRGVMDEMKRRGEIQNG